MLLVWQTWQLKSLVLIFSGNLIKGKKCHLFCFFELSRKEERQRRSLDERQLTEDSFSPIMSCHVMPSPNTFNPRFSTNFEKLSYVLLMTILCWRHFQTFLSANTNEMSVWKHPLTKTTIAFCKVINAKMFFLHSQLQIKSITVLLQCMSKLGSLKVVFFFMHECMSETKGR